MGTDQNYPWSGNIKLRYQSSYSTQILKSIGILGTDWMGLHTACLRGTLWVFLWILMNNDDLDDTWKNHRVQLRNISHVMWVGETVIIEELNCTNRQ